MRISIETRTETTIIVENDLATSREARDSNAQTAFVIAENNYQGTAWEFNISSGYYYHRKTRWYYDPKSGLYYSRALGKWVTREEARATNQGSSRYFPLLPFLISWAAGLAYWAAVRPS